MQSTSPLVKVGTRVTTARDGSVPNERKIFKNWTGEEVLSPSRLRDKNEESSFRPTSISNSGV
ncbi:hypothetical protein TIFTF001_007765 [Ficus carica]|uniref:Uncharacterized protein n=1 Tax=Ficus carica TaxID=3494 RepID=A0AA88D2A2_FICCA|nr:hypothetical protein TIFTF001_007765 [Ficus carica]